MAELSNGKDAQGRLVDPVTRARLKGGPPDYIGTILIGQTRYNADGLRRLIDIADLGIGIDYATREEWIITACLELGGDWENDTRDDLEALDEDDDDYDEAQGLLGAYPNLKVLGLPHGPAPTDAGNLWRRAQRLRDPITGLGFTETQAGIIYDNLHRGDEAAPAAAAEERHKGGARTRRKRRTAGRGGTNMAGYNANNQMDNEEERRLDMVERMKRAQKRNALQRYKEHIAIPGQIDKPGHGGNTHKNKQYSRIGKLGGNTPKSKTRKSKTPKKSKTRKSKTPKKSKTRKSRLGPPPSTVPPPPPIIKCSAFNTEKRDHKKMLEKEERKRKKSRVSRKKRQEKKRVKDMTERVVCEVRRMFSKRTPSPYDFEKEMREWLEREERKRRRRRTRRRKGGRRRKKRGGGRRTRKKRGSRRKSRQLRGGGWWEAIRRPAGGWKNLPTGIIKITLQQHLHYKPSAAPKEGKFKLVLWPQHLTDDNETLYFKRDGDPLPTIPENWVNQIEIWDGEEEGGGNAAVAPPSDTGPDGPPVPRRTTFPG